MYTFKLRKTRRGDLFVICHFGMNENGEDEVCDLWFVVCGLWHLVADVGLMLLNYRN